MFYIKDRYGSKLNKKQAKPKPEYWKVEVLLKRLKLKYIIRNNKKSSMHIIIKDFGTVFKFNESVTLSGFEGWDIINVDLKSLEIYDAVFGENLMWHLIQKGYMSYLRKSSQNTAAFTNLIVTQGWGLKIINKRLEMYNNEPKHAYNITKTEYLRDMSISYILSSYPDFFDFIW